MRKMIASVICLGITASAWAQKDHVIVETFKINTVTDTLALTSAPGGLFGHVPVGIQDLTAPVNAAAQFVGARLRDINGNVVGFASEQEVFDFPNLKADVTWTLTLPGRLTFTHNPNTVVIFSKSS